MENKRKNLSVFAILMLIGTAISLFVMIRMEWIGNALLFGINNIGTSIRYEIGLSGILTTAIYIVLIAIQFRTCMDLLGKKPSAHVLLRTKSRAITLLVLNCVFAAMCFLVAKKNGGPEGSGDIGFGSFISLIALAGVVVKVLFLLFALLNHRSKT